jgi:hypothetical protein
MRYYSLAIIFSISTLVFGGAGLILRASLNDAGSNIKVVEHIAESIMTPSDLNAQENVSVTAFAPFDTVIPEVAHIDTLAKSPKSNTMCEEQQRMLSEKPSLVDFLKKSGWPYGFKDRVAFAKQYGMMSYTGSQHDNELLMSYIRDEVINNACQL